MPVLNGIAQKFNTAVNSPQTYYIFQHASNIAFVPNASTAAHLLLSAMSWKPGDTILSTTHENPSIKNELLALQPKGVNTQFLPPLSSPERFLESLKQSLGIPTIKAILVSHVSHVDGRIFPIAEIAEISGRRNIFFAVDGAQAVGHIDVNFEALNCDAYFFSGYKWCCGPLGTGGLIIAERGSETDSFIARQPKVKGQSLASRFEIGTNNIGLIAGLAMACQVKIRKGMETEKLVQIREIITQELQHLPMMKIQGWTGPHSPGILTFHGLPPNRYTHLHQRLHDDWHIVVKGFSDYPEGECPSIRLSWESESDPRDVKKVLQTIKLFV